MKPVFNNRVSLSLVLLATAFSFGSQFYVLKYLPVVDCLPYKVGSSIPENMKIPAGSVPDSTVIMFKYNKGGQEVEFDAEHFPDDFDDSLYRFVGRYDKLIRKGNAQPPIKDLVMLSPLGTDTTQAILAEPTILVVFSKTLENDIAAWVPKLRILREQLDQAKIPMVWVSSDVEQVSKVLEEHQVTGVTLLRGDLVAIKTAARVNPTAYLLTNGKVMHKWPAAGFDRVIPYLEHIPIYKGGTQIN